MTCLQSTALGVEKIITMHIVKLPSKITVDSYVGYRIWEVSPDGRLQAVMNDYEWPSREPAESSPLSLIDGGFHAYTTARAAWNAFDELCEEAPHLYTAIGSVALWGDVSIDEPTIRATRAYPITLWTTFDPQANCFIRMAADRYGVEVMSCPIQFCDVA